LAGGLGVVAMAYDAYKSGQKHSGGKAVKGQKSFMADAKKNQTSIIQKGKDFKPKKNQKIDFNKGK